MVARGDGGGEKVFHPVFSRGQCKGVQSGRGPQLPTLDRWQDGVRAVASLLEDGVRAGAEDAHHNLDARDPHPLRPTPSEKHPPRS